MGLATPTTSFECTISDGLAHIVLNQPDRGNPIDGDFCREFNLCMAELSERDDVRSVLISARGKLFSVGGDLVALAARGDALPQTIKIWTSDLHAAIVRMVRMRAPVVMAVQGNVAGGSVSLMAAGDLVVIGKSARISAAFARIGFTPDSGSTTTVTRRIGPSRARRFFLMSETMDADAALSAGLVDFVVDDDAVLKEAEDRARTGIGTDRSLRRHQAAVPADAEPLAGKSDGRRGANPRRHLPNGGCARGREGIPGKAQTGISWEMSFELRT